MEIHILTVKTRAKNTQTLCMLSTEMWPHTRPLQAFYNNFERAMANYGYRGKARIFLNKITFESGAI